MDGKMKIFYGESTDELQHNGYKEESLTYSRGSCKFYGALLLHFFSLHLLKSYLLIMLIRSSISHSWMENCESVGVGKVCK